MTLFLSDRRRGRRLFFFFLMIPPPPRPTLFPYTTLFRSRRSARSSSVTGRAPTPCPSRASVRRGSASTPRTTRASTPAWATWTRRSGRTTRPTATPCIPASATASCGRVKGRRSRIVRGEPSSHSSGRVWGGRAAGGGTGRHKAAATPLPPVAALLPPLAAHEVLPRLVQGRLVTREQVVHRPHYDEVGSHADACDPRAVGSLVAGDRELHAPALRQRECCDVSRTPAGWLPDDETATRSPERSQKVLCRADRGARR